MTRDASLDGATGAGTDASPDPDAKGGVTRRLGCLARHYAGRVVPGGLELPDGTRLVYDDGKAKTAEGRIETPDLEDIFAVSYPRGPIAPATEDPGRVRVEPLFRATYGGDARAVSAALVDVRFAGTTVRFHKLAAPALARVATKLEPLLQEHARFFRALGGTFAVRTIAGTDRASAHSWAIAIDLDPSACDYWRNAPTSPRPVWKNRVPSAIVEAFESEGFVWGGRWLHYDTMHFEYRPELFDAACMNAL